MSTKLQREMRGSLYVAGVALLGAGAIGWWLGRRTEIQAPPAPAPASVKLAAVPKMSGIFHATHCSIAGQYPAPVKDGGPYLVAPFAMDSWLQSIADRWNGGAARTELCLQGKPFFYVDDIVL